LPDFKKPKLEAVVKNFDPKFHMAATDDLMEVQELRVVFLLGRQKGNHLVAGAEHIVKTSPFTMNDNKLVIGNKFIAGLNTVYGLKE